MPEQRASVCKLVSVGKQEQGPLVGLLENESADATLQLRNQCFLVQQALLAMQHDQLGGPAEGKLGSLSQLAAHDLQPAMGLDAQKLDDRGLQRGRQREQHAGLGQR